MALREVTYLAIVVRIAAAVVLGGIFGLERGLKNRPAGMRTYMLVCVGSCLIMLINQFLYQATGAGDPMRLGAQVVSGIGFLGAGTIIVTRRNQIRGLTTAAGLWASAGVGLALGIGFYEAAAVAGAAVFVVLTLLQRWDNKLHHRTKFLEVYVEFSEKISIGELIRGIREQNFEISSVQMESAIPEEGCRALIAALKAKERGNHDQMLEKLRTIPGIVYLEEL